MIRLPPAPLVQSGPRAFVAFHKAGQTKTTSRSAARAGRDDGISPDNVHPGEADISPSRSHCTERVGHHGYPDTSHHYCSCSPPWRRRLVRPGTLVLGGRQGASRRSCWIAGLLERSASWGALKRLGALAFSSMGT